MKEDDADIAELQQLLDRSRAGASEHLQSIITPARAASAADLVARLTGLRILALGTVSAGGRPRLSAVDGHLLRGRWVFTTSGSSVKATDMRSRPNVSAAYLEGDSVGVFTHGTVEVLGADHPDRGWIEQHLTDHYGESPSSWGPDIFYGRIQPTWMVGFVNEPAGG
ncbi:MAG TPA: pyridoxamine 5'-phosphate oxidase family protein [Streptosporangiaceae bacterium]|nr:pyridoxamine 5'-phosphate oxidase family protein [Streptosporangiaceae bacterium]